MKNITKYKGLMNVFCETDDFFHDYCYMPRTLIFRKRHEDINEPTKFGLLFCDINEERFVKIEMPVFSYIQLMSYSEPEPNLIPTHMGLMNIVTNFFDIDVLCSYMEDYDGIGDCNMSLVMLNGNKLFSVDAHFYDIVGLSMVKMFPIFIKKDIFDKYGIDKTDIKRYI